MAMDGRVPRVGTFHLDSPEEVDAELIATFSLPELREHFAAACRHLVRKNDVIEELRDELHARDWHYRKQITTLRDQFESAKATIARLELGPRQPIAASGLCVHTVAPATVPEPRTTVCGAEAQVVPLPPPCHASSQTEPVSRTRRRRRSGNRQKPNTVSSTSVARAPGASDRPPRGTARACGTAFAPRMCVAYAQGECTFGKRCFHMHHDTDAERQRAARRRVVVAKGLADGAAAFPRW